MSAVPLLEVESGGLLTTVQDLGRVGHQRDGLPVAGAMDPFAAAVANLLVGNSRSDALLEITLMGPILRALSDVRIAVCGADLSATVQGEPLPLWRTYRLGIGQRLTFGSRRSGARAYLAVAGGLQVPAVLGSRATFLRGQIGGYLGRRLQAGDMLEGISPESQGGERGLRPDDMPEYPIPAILRMLPGPHRAAFTDADRETLFSATYTLTPHSDRQGFRLSGPALTHQEGGSILSEPMPFGGLQVPPDGQPILLMADRQTTGGYPLIGTVISADLPCAAQLAPGDTVRFQPVGLPEAQALAVRQEQWLRLLEMLTRGDR